MTPREFLADLAALGVELWAEGGQLRYRGGKNALTPALLDQIRARKPELLVHLTATETAAPFPLTPNQRALWLFHQANPSSPAYNIRFAVELAAPADTSLLQQCLDLLAARHAVLATVYRTRDGQPMQQTIPGFEWKLEVLNEPESAAHADRPFDLENGPVCRVTLFRPPSGPEVLQIAAHHIAFDFAAIEILVTELRACYGALTAGRTPELAPLRATFRQHAEALLDERGWDYWRQELAGRIPALELPIAKPRPARQTFDGATHFRELDAPLTAALRNLARQEGVTLYVTLLAAYKTLLFRHSHQDDFAIGTPVSARDARFENVIGYFTNPVALRTRVTGHATFRRLLKDTRQQVLDAMANASYPFPLVLERLGVERDASRSPLFQTTFVWDQRGQAAAPGCSGDPLYAARFSSEQRGANFDLSLTVYEVDGPLRIALAYNTALYDASTIEQLASRFVTLIESIAQAPETALDHLLLEPIAPAIPTAAPADSFPLSSHQERIWFIDVFETGKVYPHHPVYHTIPATASLGHAPDKARLTTALAQLAARHQVLNMRVEAGRLQQIPNFAPTLSAEPWDAPLDLAQGPPFRAIAGNTSITLAVHHLIADAHTAALLLGEWIALYQGRELPAAQTYTTLEANPESREALLRYWRHRLRGTLQPLVLPYDHPRAPIHVFRAGVVDCPLPSAGSEIEMLAAFLAVLRRYSGQEEIIAGTADSGRAGLESVAAPISNLLVLRAALDETTTGASLAEQTRQLLASARAHRDLPFDQLVTALNPEKDMSRTALFDVLFTWHENLAFEGYRPSALGYGKYDLHLQVNRDAGHTTAQLVYNRELFEPETAEAIARHWTRMAHAIAAAPHAPIDEAVLLDEAERTTQLETWNQTRTGWPRDWNLASRFTEIAARFPHRDAATHSGVSLTYQQLDQRANRLAHRLIDAGVQGQELVALLLDRNLDLLTAILGVLKAGAAYLPLDPSIPDARLEAILADSGCRLAICGKGHRSRLPVAVTAIIPDDGMARTAPHAAIEPHHLAYCIYTSGSTGQPKGVLLEHRQVIRLLFPDTPLFDFTEHDVWTLFHSASFDFSVWELFGALLHGGRLVIVDYAVSRDAQAMHALLEFERVTILNQTPSAFGPLMTEAERHPRSLALRMVIFGGQQLDPVRLKTWHARHPHVKLINMYGITETCVHVTYREIEPADMDRALSPIGRPIPTLQTYVVDRNLRLVPRGVKGELLVGGDGLARGYLNRPELTAERFIESPFHAGERLYRSGDLCRQLTDGQLLYEGRMDDQFQIRGFRVELGEVRHALLKQTAVADAWVGAEGSAADTRLAAWVVPRIDARQIERRLAAFEHQSPGRKWTRTELPNGVLIAHRNPGETQFTYDEIFEQQSYLRHGVTLPEGAVVFDIGANIGIFSLFAGLSCRGARVFSFEPIPQTYEILRINASLHGLDIRAFPYGIASRPQTAEFTYYPHVSIFSGRFADTETERGIIRAFSRNSGAAADSPDLDRLLAERFRGEPVQCQLRTISQVIAEHAIDRIDLLKIDVEKGELDALEGIADTDWPKIRQIAMEAHASPGRLEAIRSLLERKGFQVAIEQEPSLEGTHLHNVFAVRSAGAPLDGRRVFTKANPMPGTAPALAREINSGLRRELPEYMIPSHIVIVDSLPLNANGKVDTSRLPQPGAHSAAREQYAAPRTQLEAEIAAIWASLLGAARVGIHDNFFELGGHSLLAMSLIPRLRQSFGVDFPVHALFENPTVEGNARIVQQLQIAAQPETELDALLRQLEALPEEDALRRVAGGVA